MSVPTLPDSVGPDELMIQHVARLSQETPLFDDFTAKSVEEYLILRAGGVIEADWQFAYARWEQAYPANDWAFLRTVALGRCAEIRLTPVDPRQVA